MKQQDWSNVQTSREDLKDINLIESLGWNRVFHYEDIQHGRINPTNVPHHRISFKKDNFSLWFANHKWIIAYNQNGRYYNHQRFDNLLDAVLTFKNNKPMFINLN